MSYEDGLTCNRDLDSTHGDCSLNSQKKSWNTFSSISYIDLYNNPRKHVFILRGIYQDAVQVGYVDDLTESFYALNEFAEVVDHLFSFDDLGISWESGWEEALVNQRLETHHDWVICKNHGVKVCGIL